MMFAMMNIFSLAVNACGTYGYGTIGSYLFGTVLQQYSVYVAADIRVQEISRKTYSTPPEISYYPSVFSPSCSLVSGNNLTVLAYNIIAQKCFPTGNGNYMVDCIAAWTVGYNAHLKANVSISGNYKDPDAKSPMSGGMDITFAYDYSSSTSGQTLLYCTAMGSATSGY